MAENKNILIAPLDWGLGHATRCIPLIRQLKEKHSVSIAGSGGSAVLLKKEFPDLKHYSLPDYRITYPVNRSMTLHVALHLPSIYSTVIQEKKAVNKLCEKHKFDLIISDNRFGAHAKNIPSVFITHQVNIKTPWLNKWVNKLNHRAIKNFTECWIPDEENAPGLAGELSHPSLAGIKSRYIGALTRFSRSSIEKTEDITVVLSGPEPQRTILEDILFKELFQFESLKINLVRGIYSSNESSQIKNIYVSDNLPASELEDLLHRSKYIICRSGYSAIMDLEKINANVLLIPTPQQTEQEYLAELHQGKGKYISQKQENVDLASFLNQASDIPFNDVSNGKARVYTKLVDDLF